MNTEAHEQAAGPVQTVYLARPPEDDEGVDLVELVLLLWSKKWQIVLVSALFAAAGILYAFLATPVYRAVVVLASTRTEDGANIRARLGGLASLAGLALGSPASDKADAIASLRSRALVEDFIQSNELLPVLFADKWDPVAKRWKDQDQEDWPDVREGVKYFIDHVRAVEEDATTGLVTLSVEWSDADAAAKWADDLVQRINERLRTRDLADSKLRLEYLNKQLDSSGSVELRQAVARLIEEEIQTIMLAQANAGYAFKIIDPVRVPHEPIWPKKPLVVILVTLLGGLLSSAFIIVRQTFTSSRK